MWDDKIHEMNKQIELESNLSGPCPIITYFFDPRSCILVAVFVVVDVMAPPRWSGTASALRGKTAGCSTTTSTGLSISIFTCISTNREFSLDCARMTVHILPCRETLPKE
jgi:hypothetical protein